MKTLVPATLFLFASLQAADALDRAPEDRRLAGSKSKSSSGSRHGTSRSGGEDAMDKFKEENQIMQEADPEMQEILAGGSFMIGDKEMSLADSDLEPIDIFTTDAKVIVDGVEEPASPCVFKGKGDDDSLIAKDSTGRLVLAFSTDPVTGKTMNVIPMGNDSNMYATVSSDDVDDDMMSQFLVEDVVDESERNLRMRFNKLDNRTLEMIGDCDSRGYDVIETAIVVDSHLCAHKGGNGVVGALAQSIVAGASKMYEVPGLCKKMKISHLEIHCDPSSDPIRPFIDVAGTENICANSDGFLQQFDRYVLSQGIAADVNHLLHGYDFPDTPTIGCAHVGTVCRTNGSNSAVNQISFSNLPSSQSQLVAHENAHICNARHVNDNTDIMNPWNCRTCKFFNSISRNAINTILAARACTTLEGAPTSAPTASPTEVPTMSPTALPTGTPTSIPTNTPTIAGAHHVRIEVQHDTYPEETGWTLINTENNEFIARQEPNTVVVYSKRIQKDLVLDPGMYEFQITDSWGDGICCRYGQGWFKIYVDGQLVVDNDGSFGGSTSANFELISPPTISPTMSPTVSPTAAPTSLHQVEIDVQHDTYPEETGWTLINTRTNEVVANQDPDTVFVYSQRIQEEHTLPSGTYEFHITDKWGDGICCGYGPGWFKIYVDGQVVVENNGEFARETVETFEVGGSP